MAAQNQFHHVKIHIIEGVLILVERSHRDHTIASTHNSYRLFILNHLVYIVRVSSNAGHWFMSCSFSAFIRIPSANSRDTFYIDRYFVVLKFDFDNILLS